MPLLIDSADKEQIKKAVNLEVISGITTNPHLLAQVNAESSQILPDLIQEFSLPLWIQVPEGDENQMYQWCINYWEMAPPRIIIKIPCSWEGIKLVPKLKRKSILTCVTAVFSASQALTAMQAGADFVAPYVNRATRRGIDGLELIQDIAQIIHLHGKGNILAASLKDSDEAVKAYQAGAKYLTLPWEVMQTMLSHQLTEEALQGFRNTPGGTF